MATDLSKLTEEDLQELLSSLPPKRRAAVLDILGIKAPEKKPTKTQAPREPKSKWHYRKTKVKYNYKCRMCGGRHQKEETAVDYLTNNGGPEEQEVNIKVAFCHRCPELLHKYPKREIIQRALKVISFPHWEDEK